MKYASLIFLIVFTSCYTQKKAVKDVIKADANYPEVLDGYCGQTRPPLDSTDVRVIYKEGKTIVDTVTDTRLEIINDTMYKTQYKTVFKVRRDTIYKNTHRTEVNTGRINELESDNAALTATNISLSIKAENEQKRGDKWRLWFFVVAGYLVVKNILKLIGKKSGAGWIGTVLKWLI